MKHQMPQLPYTLNQLAPVLSQQTLTFHYGKHLQAYINNLNGLIEGTPYENMSLHEIFLKAPLGGIHNNAGQVINHTLYFEQFTPQPLRHQPEGRLAQLINQQFESFDAFKEKFTTLASTLFGSGWAWLSITSEGQLQLTQEINGEIPLQNGSRPLLCFDVWEHAYYLDYQNQRASYLNKLWDIIDWEVIEKRL